jgi:hypothetical protein
MSMKAFIFGALLGLLAAGCSHNTLSGTYLPKGGGMGNGLVMQKIEFLPNNEVNILMMEQLFRANYKIDGDQVLFIINGQQAVFKLEGDGCLNGGNLYGKFCKG